MRSKLSRSRDAAEGDRMLLLDGDHLEILSAGPDPPEPFRRRARTKPLALELRVATGEPSRTIAPHESDRFIAHDENPTQARPGSRCDRSRVPSDFHTRASMLWRACRDPGRRARGVAFPGLGCRRAREAATACGLVLKSPVPPDCTVPTTLGALRPARSRWCRQRGIASRSARTAQREVVDGRKRNRATEGSAHARFRPYMRGWSPRLARAAHPPCVMRRSSSSETRDRPGGCRRAVARERE